MAANDEFPRGLTQGTPSASASGESIVFPATPGISWVLTEIDVETLVTGAVSGGFHFNVLVNGAQYSWVGADPTVNNTVMSYTWTGNSPFPADTEVVVLIDNSAPGVYVTMKATAYPV